MGGPGIRDGEVNIFSFGSALGLWGERADCLLFDGFLLQNDYSNSSPTLILKMEGQNVKIIRDYFIHVLIYLLSMVHFVKHLDPDMPFLI